MLDDAGLEDCKIVVSNSLDEYTITSILQQGGKIDSFGVGERLITAKSDPVFGAVYKISAVEEMVHLPRVSKSQKMWRRSQIRDLKMCTVSMMKQDIPLRI